VEKPHLQNRAIIDALENPLKLNEPLYLHVKATPFQLKVWEALLKLSPDRWTSYGQIAEDINYDKKACRAVGTAVGANPIAIIIPCHRVLRADGGIGGYFWGTTKKKAILMREYGLGDMAN
jgi:AraC family transcriptional regulator of adaptative response/methylated-DNA-[protein]-cysteine methyltransferase